MEEGIRKQGMGARLRGIDVENGCDLSPDCFTCPYPECVIKNNDVTKLPRAKAEAKRLAGIGYSPEQIARHVKQQLRTVKRWLQ
ncbi:MAG: hypothetical protein KAR06_02730 [Deltaproteobacteria bacterium]|nr:hypothetical protein [Deltaproteobacteria bacterium]